MMSKWIDLYEEARRENQEALGKLHDLQIQNDKLEHLVEKWEDKASKERGEQLEKKVEYMARIL